ncbi:short chain dehydrogenase [Paracoccidioides lutzii Pb01]|uniref:Short chain dehydrogenase n=1 Tax=Paracoccidioides lutzii (strain ATCC MYA-826 / Pb01) TaxID=502779 RepID=C1GYH2_PARBA|nr:short chain dehydrogenase [Paracoccidioides lutzii Pb01]EEH41563.2 short chain dehydrogenase [Paracoccidioides lutzii Pb01]
MDGDVYTPAVKLDTSFFFFRAFINSLKSARRRGVVNIASVNGLVLFILTRSIAVEYAQFGIRADAVASGTVKTQVWAGRVKANPQVFEEVIQWYPLKWAVDPLGVADAVAFLSNKELRLQRSFSQYGDY